MPLRAPRVKSAVPVFLCLVFLEGAAHTRLLVCGGRRARAHTRNPHTRARAHIVTVCNRCVCCRRRYRLPPAVVLGRAAGGAHPSYASPPPPARLPPPSILLPGWSPVDAALPVPILTPPAPPPPFRRKYNNAVSSSRRKQRKAYFDSDSSARRHFLTASLDKDNRAKYGVR